MIYLDFSWAVGIFFLVLVGVVFLSWILSRNKKDKKLTLDPKHIWHCPICAHTYVFTKQEVISSCPRCGSYNKK